MFEPLEPLPLLGPERREHHDVPTGWRAQPLEHRRVEPAGEALEVVEPHDRVAQPVRHLAEGRQLRRAGRHQQLPVGHGASQRLGGGPGLARARAALDDDA
jgi:hypothetical protein